MGSSIVPDLLIILAAGWVAGLICRRIGVSMLVGYLVVGGFLGSGGFGLIGDARHDIEQLAQLGVLMLLFSIGLEFTLEHLRRLRRIMLVGGAAQMLLTGIPVALVTKTMVDSWPTAILLGCAVAMSSTVLVFKALAEFGKTSTPAGRRTVSILLFQDAAVVPILLLMPSLSGKADAAGLYDWLLLIATGVTVVLGVLVLRDIVSRWIVPYLARLRSPELLVLFALVVLGGITLAVVKAGLPAPLGAFGAGLVLSGNRLTGQVDALILPFRESFAAIFFVSLGLLFRPGILVAEPLAMLGGFTGLLLLKFGAGTLAARATGLRWRASAGVGMGLAQIGEFAFVLAFTGVEEKLLTIHDYQRVLVLALGSLILTPQMLRIGLRWAETGLPLDAAGESHLRTSTAAGDHAIVIGIGPVGRRVTGLLEERGTHVCTVDLSPVNLHELAQKGFDTIAGDARDPEILERAGAKHARLVIVCVPVDDAALQVVSALRSLNRECTLLVRCRYLSKAEALRKAGASAVVSEEAEASEALLRCLSGTPKPSPSRLIPDGPALGESPGL